MVILFVAFYTSINLPWYGLIILMLWRHLSRIDSDNDLVPSDGAICKLKIVLLHAFFYSRGFVLLHLLWCVLASAWVQCGAFEQVLSLQWQGGQPCACALTYGAAVMARFEMLCMVLGVELAQSNWEFMVLPRHSASALQQASHHTF